MELRAPNRVTRRYRQQLVAPPSEVFPLLCPVRELEWVNGWSPSLVLSSSGLVEDSCVFVTPAVPDDALWVVTLHDPQTFRLEMVKVIPEVVVGRLKILLEPSGDGCTAAEVEYSYTSLGHLGDQVLAGFTEAHYGSFMRQWEEELNHFLRTGARLPSRPS